LGKHLAIAAGSAPSVVVDLLPPPGDVPGRLLRREGALSSRSMSALLTLFPTNALGHRLFGG